MWNTGFGMTGGMWLLMVAGTAAFWLLVVVVVKETLAPSHGPHHRRGRPSHRTGDRPSDQSGGQYGTDPDGARAGSAELQPLGSAPGDELSSRPGASDPFAVVQDRLARGDIDVDEYARIRRALVESQPSLDADTIEHTSPVASSASSGTTPAS